MRSEILGLSGNTLTVNCQYSRKNTDNLELQVQMKLSGKLKIFFLFFSEFSESALNFEHFSKKIRFIAQAFLKLLTPKDVFT